MKLGVAVLLTSFSGSAPLLESASAAPPMGAGSSSERRAELRTLSACRVEASLRCACAFEHSDDVFLSSISSVNGDERVTNTQRIAVIDPVMTEFADVAGPGSHDLFVVSGITQTLLGFICTVDGYAAAAVIALPLAPQSVVAISPCDDERWAILIGTDDPTSKMVVTDPFGSPQVTLVGPGSEWPCAEADEVDRCDARFTTAEEGECSRVPDGPGIQTCIEAADCRIGDCRWSACILRAAGDYNWFEWCNSDEACKIVGVIEILACFPKAPIEKWLK